MRPDDGSLPGRRMAQERLARAREAIGAAPLPVKILLVIALLIIVVLGFSLGPRVLDLLLLIAIGYGPVAVWRGSTSVIASVFVAAWGLAAVLVVGGVTNRLGAGIVPLLLLPCAAAAAAHIKPLARRYVPCRTVAWIMAWALPPALLAWWAAAKQPVISYVIAWALGLIVLGWRFGKAQQEARALSRQQSRTSALAAPYLPGGGPAVASRPSRRAGPAGTGAERGRPPGHAARRRVPGAADRGGRDAPGRGRGQLGPGRGGPAAAGDHPRPGHGRAGQHDRPGSRSRTRSGRSPRRSRRRAGADWPATRPRSRCSTSSSSGPPGTGKTSVARVIAKIFYAFGLLDTPEVVEAQRADLVGEYLGATAIKTNELVDRALGGVLFIDEAYSLVNDSEGQGDRFGHEAVQALLKRAEDDRDRTHHHPGRLREADGDVPGQQPRAELAVRAAGEVPRLLAGRADGAGRAGPGAARRDPRPGRPPGAVADDGGHRPPPAGRRAGQRPVRAQPAGEGRPGPRRPGDGRRRRADPGGTGHAGGSRPGPRPAPS